MLAPGEFYRRYTLGSLERELDAEVRALGHDHCVMLSFGFDVLPSELAAGEVPGDVELLALLEARRPLHAAPS